MCEDPCFRIDTDSAAAIQRWRIATRKKLISERLAIKRSLRKAYAERIVTRLEQVIGKPRGLVVSAYWPLHGEPDIRAFLQIIVALGGRAALPVVVRRGEPLVFRAWSVGEPLERGVWNIPTPTAGAETVIPDVVIAPVVGFDQDCYRLGYGGGYFDRTLATLPKKVLSVGVGYAQSTLPTIHPLPHDIALDMIVTEADVRLP